MKRTYFVHNSQLAELESIYFEAHSDKCTINYNDELFCVIKGDRLVEVTLADREIVFPLAQLGYLAQMYLVFQSERILPHKHDKLLKEV